MGNIIESQIVINEQSQSEDKRLIQISTLADGSVSVRFPGGEIDTMMDKSKEALIKEK